MWEYSVREYSVGGAINTIVDKIFGIPYASIIVLLVGLFVYYAVTKEYRKWKLYKWIRGDKAIPYEKKGKKGTKESEPPQEEPQQKQE